MISDGKSCNQRKLYELIEREHVIQCENELNSTTNVRMCHPTQKRSIQRNLLFNAETCYPTQKLMFQYKKMLYSYRKIMLCGTENELSNAMA